MKVALLILLFFWSSFGLAKDEKKAERAPMSIDGANCHTAKKNGQTIHAQLQGAFDWDDCGAAQYASALSECLITSEDAHFLSLDKAAQKATWDIIFKIRQYRDAKCAVISSPKFSVEQNLNIIRASLNRMGN